MFTLSAPAFYFFFFFLFPLCLSVLEIRGEEQQLREGGEEEEVERYKVMQEKILKSEGAGVM